MDRKIIPAIILGALGFGLAWWSIYIIISNLDTASLTDFKAPIVFIITGIILVVFAVYYARGGGEPGGLPFDELEDETVELIYEEDDENKEEFEDENEAESESGSESENHLNESEENK
ncbi:hypothetical protein MmiHf6_04740 [Methanimicrococcus hongohii]|uniref:Uncharacterized protein n=1 Tax=Methanimicrococcus hongohii TaxID=3028295 RepID=A0AA96UZF8_9EURY|nr:hypothetical protein [Methanimicrococcus sp. Hf6]WNY23170.1 hypothetical protein MmiHf6_04740 [Methanimicrococcus sp. Hf6]